MRIAYIGIDLFFPALLKLESLNCEILEIFTCKTDNVTEFNTEIINFARSKNIPLTIGKITVSDFDRLYQKGCEAVICAGYYYKIPVYKKIMTVNIHPSLLPEAKGSWPMPYFILRKQKVSGVSIHKISEDFDAGDILLLQSFELDENENHKTLMDKVYACLDKMLEELVLNFKTLFERAKPQSGTGEYLPLPDEKMYTVDESISVKDADIIFRAFFGYEVYYVSGENKFTLIEPVAVYKVPCDFYGEIFKLSDGYCICKRIL